MEWFVLRLGDIDEAILISHNNITIFYEYRIIAITALLLFECTCTCTCMYMYMCTKCEIVCTTTNLPV